MWSRTILSLSLGAPLFTFSAMPSPFALGFPGQPRARKDRGAELHRHGAGHEAPRCDPRAIEEVGHDIRLLFLERLEADLRDRVWRHLGERRRFGTAHA